MSLLIDMVARSIRKNVSFDDDEGDRALLDAIAAHQSQHDQSFSDLCKQALKQYLLSREPTQSVMLFMELQQQIAQLGARVAALEQTTLATPAETEVQQDAEPQPETAEHQLDTAVPQDVEDDPVISRLGPLLDDF